MFAPLSDNVTYRFQRSGLKTGVDNYIFWTEIRSGFEARAAHPHQEFPGVTPREFRLFRKIIIQSRLVLQSLVVCIFKLQFTYHDLLRLSNLKCLVLRKTIFLRKRLLKRDVSKN